MNSLIDRNSESRIFLKYLREKALFHGELEFNQFQLKCQHGSKYMSVSKLTVFQNMKILTHKSVRIFQMQRWHQCPSKLCLIKYELDITVQLCIILNDVGSNLFFELEFVFNVKTRSIRPWVDQLPTMIKKFDFLSELCVIYVDDLLEFSQVCYLQRNLNPVLPCVDKGTQSSPLINPGKPNWELKPDSGSCNRVGGKMLTCVIYLSLSNM